MYVIVHTGDVTFDTGNTNISVTLHGAKRTSKPYMLTKPNFAGFSPRRSVFVISVQGR